MQTYPVKETLSVLIPDGESGFALFAAHCLSCFPNVKLHVLSRDRWAAIRFSRYCHSYTFQHIDGDGPLLDAIAQLVRKHKIDVVLPTDTNGIYFALAHKDALSNFAAIAPLPEPSSFETANNKWTLSQFLKENRIPGPPSVLVDFSDRFEEKLRDLDFPVLLKPVTSRDGDGIERFETSSDLMRYLDRQQPEEVRERFVVQGFLSGPDVDLNFLSSNGRILASTIQQAIIPNTKKYAAAGAIRFIKNDSFFSVAQKLVEGLGWSGYANVDTICDKDGDLRIVDINARFWGSVRGSLAAGVSFPYLACLAALNIPFPMPDYETIRYFHPKMALREGVSGILKKSQERDIAFRESGLEFFLTDPLGEFIRIYKQEFLGI